MLEHEITLLAISDKKPLEMEKKRKTNTFVIFKLNFWHHHHPKAPGVWLLNEVPHHLLILGKLASAKILLVILR